MTSLSGNAYVPMKLRGEPTRASVRIFTVRNCDHIETVCTECVTEWLNDWVVLFDRTNGGRRLAAQIAESVA